MNATIRRGLFLTGLIVGTAINWALVADESKPIAVQEQPEASTDSSLQRIVTTSGTIYSDCKLLKVEPDGILVEHEPQPGAVGLTKIKFALLPPEIQKRFNYNPAEASQYEQLQQKSDAAWAKQLAERDQVAAEIAAEEQRESTALRLNEEKERLADERMAAAREHEENIVREEAYAAREVARWQSPVVVWPTVSQGPRHHSHSRQIAPVAPRGAGYRR